MNTNPNSMSSEVVPHFPKSHKEKNTIRGGFLWLKKEKRCVDVEYTSNANNLEVQAIYRSGLIYFQTKQDAEIWLGKKIDTHPSVGMIISFLPRLFHIHYACRYCGHIGYKSETINTEGPFSMVAIHVPITLTSITRCQRCLKNTEADFSTEPSPPTSGFED